MFVFEDREYIKLIGRLNIVTAYYDEKPIEINYIICAFYSISRRHKKVSTIIKDGTLKHSKSQTIFRMLYYMQCNLNLKSVLSINVFYCKQTLREKSKRLK